MAKEIDLKEKLKQGWIHALVTFEIIGKPAKHVDESLRKFLDTVKKEERITWISENIGRAEKTEDGFFGAFAEVDLLAKNLETLTWIAVNFTPASIEIIEPSQFKLTSNEVQNWGNDLLSTLHDIGIKVKKQNAEFQLMASNFGELISNTIILSIARGNTTSIAISRDTSLTQEIIEQHAGLLIKAGKLTVQNGYYRILPQASQEAVKVKSTKTKKRAKKGGKKK